MSQEPEPRKDDQGSLFPDDGSVSDNSRNTGGIRSRRDDQAAQFPKRFLGGHLDNHWVRVEGLEPPMGKTHQILNLAPIPVRLHPRVGRVGFEPTTYGLRIRCSSQIELATQLGD